MPNWLKDHTSSQLLSLSLEDQKHESPGATTQRAGDQTGVEEQVGLLHLLEWHRQGGAGHTGKLGW